MEKGTGKRKCVCLACGEEGRMLCASAWTKHYRATNEARFGLTTAVVLEAAQAMSSSASTADEQIVGIAHDDAFFEEEGVEELLSALGDDELVDVVELLEPAAGMTAFGDRATRLGRPVFPGARLTRAQLTAELIAMKQQHRLARAPVESFVRILRKLIPARVDMPSSYQNMASSAGAYTFNKMIGYVCVNDCIAYVGELANAQECSVCGEPRATAKKVYYHDVKEWLTRLYADKRLASLLQSHQREVNADSPICDLHETAMWKTLYKSKEEGGHGFEVHDVALALAFDGTSLGTTSVWPFMLHVLNFPPFARYKRSTSLVLFVAKGKPKPARFDAYMQLLKPTFDELAKGIKVNDASRNGQEIDVRGSLEIIKVDYEGASRLMLGTGASSYNACLSCEQRCVYAKDLGKLLFAQNRRHLPIDDVNRKAQDRIFWDDQAEGATRPFDCDHEEYRDPFPARTPASIAEDQRRSVLRAKAHVRANAAGNVLGFKGLSEVTKIPGFEAPLKLPNDFVHCVDVSVRRLLMSMRPGTSSQSTRLFEQRLGRMTEGASDLACCLSKRELVLADERRDDIYMPTLHSFDRRLKMFATSSPHTNSGDVLQAIEYGILSYCLRSMYASSESVRVVVDLAFLLRRLMRPATIQERVKQQADMNVLLCRVEAAFPYTYQVLHTHNLHHVIDGIIRYGSYYEISNLAIDRLMKQVKDQLHGTHRFEESIMKIAEESMFVLFTNEMSVVPEKLERLFLPFLRLDDAAAPVCEPVDEDGSRLHGRIRTVVDATRCAFGAASSSAGGDGRWKSIPKLIDKSSHSLLDFVSLRVELADVYSRLVERERYSKEAILANGHMSSTLIEFNRCMLVDARRGKVFEYRSAAVDESSASRSSYLLKDFAATAHDAGGSNVWDKGRRQTRLGQIRRFFNHQYRDKMYEFAYVAWFSRPRDYFAGAFCAGRLWFVDAPGGKPVVTIYKLHPVHSLLDCQAVVAECREDARLFALGTL